MGVELNVLNPAVTFALAHEQTSLEEGACQVFDHVTVTRIRPEVDSLIRVPKSHIKQPATWPCALHGPGIRSDVAHLLPRIPDRQSTETGFGLESEERCSVCVAASCGRHQHRAARNGVVRDIE